MKFSIVRRLSTGCLSQVMAVFSTIVLTSVLFSSFPAFSAAADDEPTPFLGTSVPGATADPTSVAPDATSSTSVVPVESQLPAPASFTFDLPAGSEHPSFTTPTVDGVQGATITSSWVPLGDTGLAVAQAGTVFSSGSDNNNSQHFAPSSPPVGSVSATILDAATATTYGSSGVAFQLSRTDDSDAQVPLGVRIPMALVNGLYGADYASRVRWVQASADATERSEVHTVPVTMDADGQALVLTPKVTSKPIIMMSFGGPISSSGTGSFAATSLKPSSSWNVSAQTGDFSWDYPMRVPPAAAGPSPKLGLTYDSQVVDGLSGSTNNQPSAVGEGWSAGGSGFIERTYVSCSQDDGASGAVARSGDLCWKTDNATISLAGHSGQLVKDSATGVWKVQSDDGSRVEHLVGTAQGCAANGTYDTDCWRLTTRDGTQYWFGLNQLPGWSTGKPTTQSTWTVPVFGNDSGEPCNGGTFAVSSCVQGWRWNLDYVVDVHQNAQALYYTAETNNYALNGTTTTGYIRGGQLDHLDYGMSASTIYSPNAASGRVVFGYNQYGRCSDATRAKCTKEPLAATATPTSPSMYPDIPFDQLCTGASCTSLVSPTFWTTGMLDTVTTQVLVSGKYSPVDVWTLGHSFPDPGDGTAAALWLTKIDHTGYAPDGTTLSEPTTTFAGTTLQNRVWVFSGFAPLDKYRISSITTAMGGVISVNYSAQECTPAGAAAILAAPESNTKRCFPQTWVPQVVPAAPPQKDLFHKYVVTSVVSNPKTGGGNDLTQETDYVYTGSPAWRYNTSPFVPEAQRTWSVYAGYNAVEIRVGDSAKPSAQQTTAYTFYQGMDGDRADAAGSTRSVSVTGAPGTADSLWFAGATRETKVLNGVGGAVLSTTISTPWASPVTATDGLVSARMTGGADTVTTSPLSTGGNRTTETKTVYDSTYGLPVTVETVTSDAGNTCATNTYAPANTSAWLIGFPSEVATVGTDCGSVSKAKYPDAAISDVRTSYDGLAWGASPTVGEVTSTQIVDSYSGVTAGSAHWVTTAKNTYDSMGRPVSTTDVQGHTTTTAYTPAAGAPAGSGALTSEITTSTAPFSWTNSMTFNPAWGVQTSTTDANGKLTTVAYDALGRRTAVWFPGWPQSKYPTSPSTQYEYTLSQTSPNAVATTTTAAGVRVRSFTLFDGLGQQVQTQTPSPATGTIITDTAYDTAGRAYMANNSYWSVAVDPSAALFVPTSEAQIPSETVTSFDGAGRPTVTALNSFLVEQYRTTYAYPGADRTDITPPTGGTPTSSFTDSLGHQTKLTQYLDSKVSAAATQEITNYGYNVQGKMTSMTDPAGNTWSWGFDVLGRQTRATDPDAGTSTKTYDSLGNVLTSTDGRGTTLAYTYDALSRPTGQYTPSADSSGSLLASWTYDTLAKGQLTSSSSFTGSTPGKPGLEYKDSITGYNDSYQPAGETVSIPSGAPAFGGTTYTTSMFYFPDGALSIKNYPAAGGLPAERLRFGYSNQGKLSFVSGFGSTTYASATFTAIGQVAQNTRRSTAMTMYSVYGYDLASGALLTVNDISRTGVTNTTQANRVYTRDNAGNITSASVTGTATTDTQCYGYDFLQNLTTAWTPKSNKCNTAPTSTTLGGAAPYWNTYTVDPATGNRTGMVVHASAAGGKDSTTTYTYPAAGARNPHAVQSVTTVTGGTTTTNSYGYDSAGSTATRPNQTLAYNPVGKLDTVTVGANTQSNVYDANGTLLLQNDPTNGSTLFLGDTQLHQAAGATATTGVRTYSCNGTPVAERTTTAGATGTTLYWVGSDVDGSPDLEINVTTAAVTHRFTDPYGNLRGTPPTWSSSNGFLNKPASTFSGLTYVGARAYDPGLGKFLSVDAVLSPFHPQQNNGYAYSNNNPVTLSDPSGNRPSENPDSSYHPGDYLPGGGGSSSAPPAAGNSGGGMSRSKGSGPEYVSVSPHVLITKDGGLVPGMRSAYAATRNSFGFTPNSTLSETQEMALWFQTCLVNSPGTCDSDFATQLRQMNSFMPDDYTMQLQELTSAGIGFFFFGIGTTPLAIAVTEETRIPKTGGAAPVRAGQAGEEAVRNVYDIGPKVKDVINGRNRIFDGLNGEAVSEVKNVAYQANTQQLKDSLAYAQQDGLRFDLYVRGGVNATALSGPLDAAVRAGEVNLRYIP